MKKIPFGHTPDTELFYQTKTHIDALNILIFSISSGESFCKITGEVGSGKTMLCRVLIRKLEKKRILAYIPNPQLSVESLYYTLAKELGIRVRKNTRGDQILQSIQNKLIKINQKHGPVVLIIDEAQVMSDQTLEALRLFTNIETEQQKLLQIVLFAQPELNKKLLNNNLRQLNQRINFSYQLKNLTASQVIGYIEHRISRVCFGKKIKVSFLTAMLAYYFSRGTPRIINTLCHKSLLLGYAKNNSAITMLHLIKSAIDTESVNRWLLRHFKAFLSLLLVGVSTTAFAFLGVS